MSCPPRSPMPLLHRPRNVMVDFCVWVVMGALVPLVHLAARLQGATETDSAHAPATPLRPNEGVPKSLSTVFGTRLQAGCQGWAFGGLDAGLDLFLVQWSKHVRKGARKGPEGDSTGTATGMHQRPANRLCATEVPWAVVRGHSPNPRYNPNNKCLEKADAEKGLPGWSRCPSLPPHCCP